ncbi:alpha/beta fold hydrolase [Pseudomonas aeruginosa]|nr:alpha/beta fold hydrolase [Pseudomonas aeruginosa]
MLDRPRVGIRDSFFDLGGTSLSAMRFMLLIEKRYGVDLPMAALIETPTVEGLAERLRERSAVRAFDPLVPIRAGGSRPPLFLVHPLGGHVLCYLPLVRALPPDQPVYALQAAGTGQGSTPLAVLEDIAASYLAAIRRVQPEGPYYLGGWSFGGFVAYEMARQLRALDPQAVAQLIVLDSITVDRNHAGSASDEALLLFFYWELVWFERSDEEVEPLPEGASLEQKLDHIVERAIEAGVLPAGTPRAFPPCALDAIEQAIRTGEFQHGGQLRFVVEGALDGSPLWRNQSPGERALDLFARLGVWDTAHNSGVLIYVLLADRAVEIVADRGIHACCGAERWSAVCQRMEAQFAQGRFEAGALEGIVAVSHLLVQHFPRGADHGNELPDRPVLL